MLDSLDRLLEDPQLLALSTQALASRSPRSNKAGREGIAPDRLLRCVVLKHLKGWSFRELHRELRASLLYRRFCRCQTRHPEKILSLFEPHSAVIRKGKAHKPNEFGRLVRIDEVEKGVVSNYAVASGNLCDQQQWVPALEAHVELFGRAPQLAAADRGFWNGANEKAAARLGVKQVVLPGRGRLSPPRAARQKERWFRRGQGWRAGIEARLSTLKHRFGMQRALYKGEIGFERHVGWCIIAHNLVAMGRAQVKNSDRRCRSG